MHPEKLADAQQRLLPVQNPSYRAFIERRERVIVFELADRLAHAGDGSAMHLAPDAHPRPTPTIRTRVNNQ